MKVITDRYKKTTKEMIAVMQAYIEGKQIQNFREDKNKWMDDQYPAWDWDNNTYRVKIELPKTWEEYCDIFHDGKGRTSYTNELEALDKLLKLRDYYNGGWTPNYNIKEENYSIYVCNDEIIPGIVNDIQHPMTFKNDELRDEFLKNFKELLEQAKPLL